MNAPIDNELHSPIWQRRERAITALAGLHDTTTITLLVHCLARDTSHRVRSAAQQVLVQAGSVSIQPLIDRWVSSLVLRDWQDEPDPERENRMRHRLLQTLALLGAAAVDAMVPLLNHTDWAVQSDTAQFLGFVKDHRTEQALVQVLTHDTSLAVQLSAAAALERFSSSYTLDFVRQWYRMRHVSAKQILSTKLLEYLSYGETDPRLMERLEALAQRHRLSGLKVVHAYWNADNPRLAIMDKECMLSPQECTLLEELYQYMSE